MFAIASMMLATSCSNDEFDSLQNGKESTVTFTAQLPDGLQTKSRAYGDGETAKTLTYAVYEVGENNTWNLRRELGKIDEPIDMTTTVQLRLVNGNKYVVVFWADAPESIYQFDADGMKVAANYYNKTPESNEEAYDAFYAVEEINVDGTSLDKTVYLKRPFAQLNIGTADWEAAKAAGHKVTKAGIKVKTYNTLNFQKQDVEGEKDEVTFNLANLPGDEQEFPVEPTTYKYLTMNYLLMPKDKETDNTVTIIYDSAPDFEIKNVPLQRNYRTNVYGNLLTSQNDITVTINPDFEEAPGHPVEIWDGSTITSVNENAAGEYEIYSGAQLAWIAQQVNNNSNTFNGKTVKLMNDIYLADAAWTPIGILNKYPGSQSFAGSFDGNGKIIYGLNVTLSKCAGLFGTIDANAKINNVTVKGAKINSKHYAGVILGYAHATATIENCVVEDATVVVATEFINNNWDNGDKAGGIAGYVANVIVKNNSVRNTHITAYRDLGGIVGYANNATVTGNNIENVNITIDATNNYKNYLSKAEYGANNIIGKIGGTTTNGGNTGTASISEPAKMVSTAEELKNALPVHTGASVNPNANIILTADIDMSDWTSVDGNYIDFVLDGQGHSLKNLSEPMFKSLAEGKQVFKNIKFEKADIDETVTNSAVGVVTSDINAQKSGTVAIENCTVSNSVIKAYKYAGAFVGIASGENGTLYFKNCTVSNTTVATEDSSCGGLVGHNYNTCYITGCKVLGSSSVNCAENRENGAAKAGYLVGTVNSNTTTISDCEVASSVTLGNINASSTVENGLVGRIAATGNVVKN